MNSPKLFGLILLGILMISKLNISMTIGDMLILVSGLLFISLERTKEDAE